MTLKTLLIVSAILAMGFGIAFMLLPVLLASLYGLELGPGGVFMTQHLGVDIAGYGLLAWLLRNDIHTQTMKRFLLGFFVIDVTGLVLSLTHQLTGTMNPMGWSIVAIHFLFALGWGYFRFVNPPILAQ